MCSVGRLLPADTAVYRAIKKPKSIGRLLSESVTQHDKLLSKLNSVWNVLRCSCLFVMRARTMTQNHLISSDGRSLILNGAI